MAAAMPSLHPKEHASTRRAPRRSSCLLMDALPTGATGRALRLLAARRVSLVQAALRSDETRPTPGRSRQGCPALVGCPAVDTSGGALSAARIEINMQTRCPRCTTIVRCRGFFAVDGRCVGGYNGSPEAPDRARWVACVGNLEERARHHAE